MPAYKFTSEKQIDRDHCSFCPAADWDMDNGYFDCWLKQESWKDNTVRPFDCPLEEL